MVSLVDSQTCNQPLSFVSAATLLKAKELKLLFCELVAQLPA